MSEKSITNNFDFIGVPLHNNRWSWGASNDCAVVLRAWHDHTLKDPDGVRRTLIWRPRWRGEKSPGINERLKHIEEIKAGKPCFIVLVTDANLGTGKPRKIAPSKERRAFRCGDLLCENDTIKIELLSPLENMNALKAEITSLMGKGHE